MNNSIFWFKPLLTESDVKDALKNPTVVNPPASHSKFGLDSSSQTSKIMANTGLADYTTAKIKNS